MMQCPVCEAAIKFPPFGNETGVVCWYCKAQLTVRVQVNTGAKTMTVKMQCMKISHVWGGFVIYDFESIGNTKASWQVTLSEEDPTRYKLGQSLEIEAR